MSALPPKADMCGAPAYVCFGPIADSCTAANTNRYSITSSARASTAGVIACVAQWASTDFGPLEYTKLLRLLILSLTAIAIGIQLALTGFLSAIVEIPVRSQVG